LWRRLGFLENWSAEMNPATPPRILTEDERTRRLAYKLDRLPGQMERARHRLMNLEQQATDLGLHDLAELRNSKLAGDLIAAEWLRRLGI
jgi:hypothetical protein